MFRTLMLLNFFTLFNLDLIFNRSKKMRKLFILIAAFLVMGAIASAAEIPDKITHTRWTYHEDTPNRIYDNVSNYYDCTYYDLLFEYSSNFNSKYNDTMGWLLKPAANPPNNYGGLTFKYYYNKPNVKVIFGGPYTIIGSIVIVEDTDDLMMILHWYDTTSQTMYEYWFVQKINNIEEIIKNNTVSIYPNPTTSDFTVSFELEKSCNNVKILLCDVLGIELANVYDSFAPEGFFIKTINTEYLPKSVYFLKILINGNYTVEKIVVN